MAKLTTIGIYQYDEHLFDGLTFPTGIDKDIAVSQILDRSAEFEILYPNPIFFSQMITLWGKKHYRTFEKWVEGLAVPFDPLYNYDRFEEYLDEKVGASTKSGTSNTSAKDHTASSRTDHQAETRNADGSATNQDVENTLNSSNATTETSGTRQNINNQNVNNDATNETQVSAFDSSAYSPKEKVITDGTQVTIEAGSEASATTSESSGESKTTTGKTSQSTNTETAGSDIQSSGASIGESSRSEDRTDKEQGTSTESTKHTAHLYGNIGVTTSAQMLKEFLDIERWNIYEQIADLFVDEFCIMVY